jgi:hypothetical protein
MKRLIDPAVVIEAVIVPALFPELGEEAWVSFGCVGGVTRHRTSM